jgi:bifunctional non-homologous end joining protein LigD
MSDALDDYHKKRDFVATPEPSGTKMRTQKTSADHALQFCMQKHDATGLHKDFRLELENTLKSWAVRAQQGRGWKTTDANTEESGNA